MKGNIFDNYSKESKEEIFDKLYANEDIIIERIISYGNRSPEDEWFDQNKDEWVILLDGNAKIAFEDNSIVELNKGDYIYLPAHKKHRVSYTSNDPNCIWLAFHFKSI